MSAPINDGGPAFPQQGFLNQNNEVVCACHYYGEAAGMTLRDWFASRASEEDIKAPVAGLERTWYGLSREERKYRYADAMIAARAKKGAV